MDQFEGLLDEGDVLDMGEAGVEAVQREQLIMGAALDDFAVPQDQDQVGVADGAEAMGDDEAGATGHEPVQSFLDEPFEIGRANV